MGGSQMAKNAVAYWVATGVGLVGSLLRGKVAATVLGASGVGITAQLATFSTLVVALAALGLGTAGIKLIAQARGRGEPGEHMVVEQREHTEPRRRQHRGEQVECQHRSQRHEGHDQLPEQRECGISGRMRDAERARDGGQFTAVDEADSARGGGEIERKSRGGGARGGTEDCRSFTAAGGPTHIRTLNAPQKRLHASCELEQQPAQPVERQPDDIEVVALDAAHERRRAPLNAIRAGLVE